MSHQIRYPLISLCPPLLVALNLHDPNVSFFAAICHPKLLGMMCTSLQYASLRSCLPLPPSISPVLFATHGKLLALHIRSVCWQRLIENLHAQIPMQTKFSFQLLLLFLLLMLLLSVFALQSAIQDIVALHVTLLVYDSLS